MYSTAPSPHFYASVPLFIHSFFCELSEGGIAETFIFFITSFLLTIVFADCMRI